MPGYANRVITLTFPDLAQPGDHIEVVIRNPRLVAPEELRAAAGAVTGADTERIAAVAATQADGAPVPDEAVTDEDVNRGYAVMAKLIIGWHVYDATSTADDQPLLPLPATPALVGKLPMEIIERLGEELAKANPQRTPESREATGTPS